LKSQNTSIEQSVVEYLQSILAARSYNTYKTYGNALKLFSLILGQHKIKLTSNPSAIPEESTTWFINYLHDYSIATERLYLTAIFGYFEYLFAEQLSSPNLPRIKNFISRRARRPTQRLPQFPHNNIVIIINHVNNIVLQSSQHETVRLRNYRDRAFLLVLADTGLRVQEACSLNRGSIDWNESKAIVVIKGGRESIVRFSERSLIALRDYLSVRANLDGISGKPLASLPIFARHDRGAGNKIKRISSATGRNIVHERVREILGPEAVGTITPHSFRHYFVTVVLRSTGNLKLAQELARHRNIAITQRYAHLSDDELDKGYHDIFNQ
jgi:integrase/recombinase XerC